MIELMDLGFLPMTLNFFETSIWKHGLTNVLCISLSPAMCNELQMYDIDCYDVTDTHIDNKDRKFGSKVFCQS